jgi:hypothetical protein
MNYSPEHYEEALALRKQGKDDTSIRMVLASKRIPLEQIDAIFFALDDVLPRNEIQQIERFAGDKTHRKIELRDYYFLMITLITAAIIFGFLGYFTNFQALMILGVFVAICITIFLLYALREDLRQRINKD